MSDSDCTDFKGMRFSCPKRLEEMRSLPDGNRFCESCAKPVIDFTAWKDADLRAWFAEHPDTCGHFRLEQVQPDMIEVTLPAMPRDLMRGAFAALAALSLSTVSAQRAPTDVVPTEQVSLQRGQSPVSFPEEKVEDGERCWAEKESIAPPAAEVRRKRYYLSKRFPFVFRARYRVIGCPSF
ncbi:MAG: hypothetical protein IPK70_16750 [Flavobacteriales bacterium]|jgi:hypothetical protein|nr:hypothetical protein [Flavobacteriales bacterium]